MRILLTGSGGFVGGELLKALARDKRNSLELLRWKKPSWFANGKRVGWSSQRHPLEIDVALLVGGAIPHGRLDLNDIELASENVNSTVAFTKIPLVRGTRIVYLSTVDVYGPGELISEKSRPNPQSLYGMSKYFSERVLEAFALAHGHQIAILRAATIYGPGDSGVHKVIPKMVTAAVNGQPISLQGNGLETRNFLFVDDLVEIVQSFLALETRPPVLNLVGPESISVRQVADLVSTVCGVAVNRVGESSIPQTPSLEFDQTLLRELFPAQFHSFQEGLRKTIREYLG